MVLSNFPLDFNTGTGIDYCYWKIKHKAIFKKYIVMPIKYKLQYTQSYAFDNCFKFFFLNDCITTVH